MMDYLISQLLTGAAAFLCGGAIQMAAGSMRRDWFR